jgi:hypothetical protein
MVTLINPNNKVLKNWKDWYKRHGAREKSFPTHWDEEGSAWDFGDEGLRNSADLQKVSRIIPSPCEFFPKKGDLFPVSLGVKELFDLLDLAV